MSAGRTRAAAALVAAALITAGLATGAGGATNASGLQIAKAPTSNFPDMAFSLVLPSDQPLKASQVQVTENGAPVRDVGVTKPGADKVGTVLLIDASDSMAGKPIAKAMAAARAFAARRGPGQRLALVTFNDKVNVVLPLTNDAASISKALAVNPPLAKGTRIYDGLDRSGTLLKDAGITGGSIVLLSDGKDVGSDTDQEKAIATVNDAKARVFAVGLHSPQYDPDTLRAISAKTSGTYSEASSGASLTEIYKQLGYTLSHEYLLTYRSLANPDAKVAVVVGVKGVPSTAQATYTTPALATLVAVPAQSQWDKIVRSSITQFLVVLIVVGLLGYAVFRIVYRPDQALTRRIGQFVTLPEAESKQRMAEVEAVLGTDGKRREGRWQRFEDDVEFGRMGMPARTIALLTIIGGLVLGVIVAVLIGSPVGLLAMLVAPFVTNTIVKRRVRSVQGTFSDQLPDNLDVLASGLRSGHSFIGALAVCVDDAAEPSKSEFQRVITDEQLGIPIDESLHVVAKRMNSRDVVQIALVARLQREAGTNAADVLDQVADNVRARLELRRLVTTLTAQGRMARWIVSLLPILLFIAIYLLNPDYLSPLWTEAVGIVALICAGIMIVVGSLVIKRIIEIEV